MSQFFECLDCHEIDISLWDYRQEKCPSCGSSRITRAYDSGEHYEKSIQDEEDEG